MTDTPRSSRDWRTLLREARDYVSITHMHHKVSQISGDRVVFEEEPCSRCELRKRIDAVLETPLSERGRNEFEVVGLFRKIDGKWVEAEDRSLCEGGGEETAQFLYRSTEGDQ